MIQQLEAIAKENDLTLKEMNRDFYAISFKDVFDSKHTATIELIDNGYILVLPNARNHSDERQFDNKEQALAEIQKYISEIPKLRLEKFIVAWQLLLRSEQEENYLEIEKENYLDIEKILMEKVKYSTLPEKRFIGTYLMEYFKTSTPEEDKITNQILEQIKNDSSLPDIEL